MVREEALILPLSCDFSSRFYRARWYLPCVLYEVKLVIMCWGPLCGSVLEWVGLWYLAEPDICALGSCLNGSGIPGSS